MTKKDYILIAEALKKAEASEYTIKCIADTLQKDNPRFNYKTFWLACGGSL